MHLSNGDWLLILLTFLFSQEKLKISSPLPHYNFS